MKFSVVRLTLAVSAALAMVVASGCRRDPERREFEYFPDMYRNPALKPQEQYDFFRDGSAMRLAPEGTIHRAQYIYPYSIVEGAKAGEELENPLPATLENLQRGRKYYNIHCAVCHGTVGAGNGLVTIMYRDNGMPIPPSIYTDKIREWKDGELYHTIVMGQGQMPGYGARIAPEDRWAIVHYVRALGDAAAPTEEDLRLAERMGLGDARRLDSPYFGDTQIPQLYLGDSVRNRPTSE